MTQQESLDPLQHLTQIVRGSMSCAHQIAHRLVPFVGNPDRREFARSSRAKVTASRRSFLMP